MKRNKKVKQSLVSIYMQARKAEQPMEHMTTALKQLYGQKMDKLDGTKLIDFVKGKVNQARATIKSSLVKIDGKNVAITVEKDETTDTASIFRVKTDDKGRVAKGLDGKVVKVGEALKEGEYKELTPPTLWPSNKKNSEDELLNFVLEASIDL